MALDKNSSGFTFGFAFVLVVVVGALLASVSMGLKDLQNKNKDDKKRMDILGAFGVEATRDNAAELYTKHIKKALIVSGKDKTTGKEAFAVDIQKEFRNKNLEAANRNYPLYIGEKEGKTFYIIPMVGKGLWGPIWGYVALGSDKQTIYGTKFDHKGETPGLGAEIKTEMFTAQFKGEKINSKISVVKDGSGKGVNSKVDAITGGTITSVGVEEMVDRTLKVYSNYFKTQN
ncbi:MAG: NADH:ubiquinone reductase (Na(+)-transporting) subunit C [Flavobacteriales bacterium]